MTSGSVAKTQPRYDPSIAPDLLRLRYALAAARVNSAIDARRSKERAALAAQARANLEVAETEVVQSIQDALAFLLFVDLPLRKQAQQFLLSILEMPRWPASENLRGVVSQPADPKIRAKKSKSRGPRRTVSVMPGGRVRSPMLGGQVFVSESFIPCAQILLQGVAIERLLGDGSDRQLDAETFTPTDPLHGLVAPNYRVSYNLACYWASSLELPQPEEQLDTYARTALECLQRAVISAPPAAAARIARNALRDTSLQLLLRDSIVASDAVSLLVRYLSNEG
jgi:hypothetical protein